ncbi:LysE family translocator [Roseibacterium sp. SDUM158017]|uniref:LysE family translocator n=1 Tax=Roseicyclus salinarum TaxID=3036773 RepID=UPI0024156C1B|nr:LysE family translocator [Roseibacterium sp. SDUM158017]MDG4647571.1 LysE family translocator [Roseibacterium sp. SDUM158017]
MLEFAAAVFFLIVTPGPGVLSTAGVGSAYGWRPGLRYVAGLWAGTNLVALLVVSGLAAAALAIPWLRAALLWGSAAYLLYLAARIAFAGTRIAFIHPERPPGLRAGVALQAINPKAYAVNTALFSGFAFMAEAMAAETALKFLIMNLIWIPLHLLWLWAGVGLRRLDLAPRMQRGINGAMAASMLVVVALAVGAQL